MSDIDQEQSGGAARPRAPNFIRAIVAADLAAGRHGGRVVTRFPPEPNGYLHIGHAKSICLNFGIAAEQGGVCNLRLDDTNPATERMEYVASIQEAVRWLGFDWGERLFFASDYFERLYEFAEGLIRAGLAYVCSLAPDEIRRTRGTLTEPGQDSPFRNRSVEENLDLFRRMRAGEFENGAHVLRARIDMASPNLNMRDPTLYRIVRGVPHYRTGERWCIYPLYDFTHCLSDALEGITHSLCTLEFEDHRALYDWVLDHAGAPCHPQQIEFARLNLEYTIVSKRRLSELVRVGYVDGWDDPRMPTLSGLRRRGYTPAAIREFCERIGVTKKDASIDMAVLEGCVREDLEHRAPRAMGVLNPLKVVIWNYPEGRVEHLSAPNHPNDPAMGTRPLPFSRVLYIERDDFMEEPPKKFFRLAPGREVRLRYAYLIRCDEVVKDPATGEVSELRCSYDPETRGGSVPDGRKVKATLHWVSAGHAARAEVRLYDRLFTRPDPTADKEVDYKEHFNAGSKVVLRDCPVEPALAGAAPEARIQLERLGYFCVDRVDSGPGRLVLNRTVTLKDTWARVRGRG